MQHPVGQPEIGRDPGRLRLRRIAPRRGQLGLGPGVLVHRRVADVVVVMPHVRSGPVQPGQHMVQAAGRQDPVLGEHAEVAGPRVLRQIADGSAAGDLAGRGLCLAGENLGQRGLAGSVPADQADLVARGDLERDMLEQQSRTRANLQIPRHQHERPW